MRPQVRVPEPPGEFERERDREVAERAARRDVYGNRGKDRVIRGNAIESGHCLGNSSTNDALDGKDHAGSRNGDHGSDETSMIRSRIDFDSMRPSRLARS